MKQPERYMVWKQLARTSEFTGFVHILCALVIATSVVVIGLASFLAPPPIYILDGISQVFERVLSW